MPSLRAMTTPRATSQDAAADPGRNRGSVVAVRESVVDVRFPDHLPDLLDRLEAGPGGAVVLEVVAHLHADVVRTIALCPTSGLYRGAPVLDCGQPLQVPVGPALLGRMLEQHAERPVPVN